MQIRFCARCNESIPEADFDAGSAVTVKGSHYHVACALARNMATGRPRSWLTFVLALYAAGVTTFLLIGALTKDDTPQTVPDVVAARIEAAADEVIATTRSERAARVKDLETVRGQQRAADAKTVGALVQKELEGFATRLDDLKRDSAAREAELHRQVQRNEDELGRLNEALREAIELAKARPVVAPAPPPVVVPPQPTPPEPAPGVAPPTETPMTGPEVDPALEAQVDRWIEQLKASSENDRFEAALQLGTLKNLRAAPALIEVLQKDRDYYVRLGAATALGDMRAAIAVPALTEALGDKDTLVRTAANDALQAITDHAIEFRTEMKTREVRKVQKEWGDWWKANEAVVRDRLGQ